MGKTVRRILGLIFMTFMICCVLPMKPVFAEEEAWTYTISDGAAIIQSYNGEETGVTIPTSVEYNGETYEVKSIGKSAFDGNTYLQSVTIPENITKLGEYAFRNCANLNKVIFEGNLDTDTDVFYNAGRNGGGITVVFGDKVTRIPDYLFDSYYGSKNGNYVRVKKVQMSDNITVIGQAAFSSCLELEEIIWSKNLEEIYPEAFLQNESLKEIILPGNVKFIGEWAFAECSKVEKIVTPARTMCVAKWAFANCVSLNSLHIKGDFGNRSIENPMPDSSFFENSDVFVNAGLQAGQLEVIFEEGVTIIPDGLFAVPYYAREEEYPRVTSVQIADSVELVGSETFTGCKNMKKAMILGADVEICRNSFLNTTTIYGYADSYVERQAAEYGILFVAFKEEVKSPFIDVKETDWFYNAAMYVSSNGIMGGLTADTFGPTKTLTRAQFATILYQLGGNPVVEYSAKFSDIPKGEWFTDGVLWANSIGVVGGYNNGTFGPSNNITREQMALMMYNYAKYKGYDTSKTADISSYSDASKVNSYAQKALKWAVGNQIIGGKAGNKLDPQGKATRAECAVIMMKFVEKNEK